MGNTQPAATRRGAFVPAADALFSRRRSGARKRVIGLFLSALFALAPTLLAQPGTVAPDAAWLLDQISTSPQIERNLQVLCGQIGGRMTGTPKMRRAVDWAVQAFRDAGVDAVSTEEFQVPNSWREGATRIEVLEPARFPVRGVSSAWVPATRAGGIRAELIDGGSGSPGRILRLGERARGKILLISSQQADTFEQLANEQRDSTVALREAAEIGAAAVLFTSTRPNGLLYRHINVVDGRLDLLPTALIARDDALRIRRLLDAGQKVELLLSLPNHVGGPFQARNVVAEIRGRELPGEVVILGAHLDSWDLGQGCLDNGCNVALILEIARALAQTGARPRRTIRFILFDAEEQGLLGSRAYVQAHRAELDSVVAVIVHDLGVGKVSGYSLGGRRDIEAGLREALKPLDGRSVEAHSYEAFFGSDHFDFLLEGVPALVAIQDTSRYVPYYHSSADSLDKVDIGALREEAGVAAVAAYDIADRPERLGKRLNREQIQHLLEETRLDDQLKFLGLWEQWESGLRGRTP